MHQIEEGCKKEIRIFFFSVGEAPNRLQEPGVGRVGQGNSLWMPGSLGMNTSLPGTTFTSF